MTAASISPAGTRPIGQDPVASAVEAYEDPDTLLAGFEFYRAFDQDALDNGANFETPLAMPVLALYSGGLLRKPFVLETMRPLANDVRGGVIEGVGHWLPEEAPKEVSSRILAFASEVDAP